MCLRRGSLYINLPVFVLLIAVYGLLLISMKLAGAGKATGNSLPHADPGSPWGLLMFIPLFILLVILLVLPAWLWWSYATPKWRIWALQNVDDWHVLEEAAIQKRLIWPRTSIFNLTEIKSFAQKTLERELISYRDENG
jgi:hypothetical protein